jgi:dipeptidyl aminopeptidase/acylaminoacyl peptidase
MLAAFATFAIVLVATGAHDDPLQITFSEPARIVDIDTTKLKGEISRLAWSPDATQMYLQTTERDSAGAIKEAHHYVLALNGTAPKRVDQEPEWAATYWNWKSAQAAPALPGFRIEVEDRQQRRTNTATPMGGDLARGAPEGGSVETGTISAVVQSQMAHYYTLRLKGEVIGEFVNVVAVPGLTFGWGPQGSALIAFANQDGRIVVMNEKGQKRQVPASKAAFLPAWTDNGTRIAYLERAGKNKAVLKIVDVKQRMP